MKATGRRAWRQRAKRKRWGYYDWLLIKRHRWIVDAADPVNLVKPFTPRSLVGMSEGAKKRAAWYAAVRAGAPPITNNKLRLCLKWLPQAVLSATVSLNFRQEIRTKYRIGQRLTPCPGCCACKSKMLTRKRLKRAGHTVAAWWPKQGEAWICGVMIMSDQIRQDDPMHQIKWHCDGSGVLPAKRSAR